MKLTLLIAALAAATACAADTDAATEVTKTSLQPFDIPKEVVAFTGHLIENNAGVGAKYAKLTGQTREEAGGRFHAGEFVPIQWLVPAFHGNFTDTGGTRDGEFIYLACRQLVLGERHGYTVSSNVVARIHVSLHEDHLPDPRKKEDFILQRTTLKLRFDGFVAVDLKPL